MTSGPTSLEALVVKTFLAGLELAALGFQAILGLCGLRMTGAF